MVQSSTISPFHLCMFVVNWATGLTHGTHASLPSAFKRPLGSCRAVSVRSILRMVSGASRLGRSRGLGQQCFKSRTVLEVVCAIRVLSRVAVLITHAAEESVEATSQQRPQDGAEPVCPEIPGERTIDHCGAKRAGRIEGATGEIDSYTKYKRLALFYRRKLCGAFLGSWMKKLGG